MMIKDIYFSLLRLLTIDILSLKIEKVIKLHLDSIEFFMVDSRLGFRKQKLDNLKKKALRGIEYCMNAEHRPNLDLLQDKYKVENVCLHHKITWLRLMHT